jgi:GTP cyclohydrolase I
MDNSTTGFVNSLSNSKTDKILGLRVREHLIKLGLEPAQNGNYNPELAHREIAVGIYNMYSHLGLDVQNDPSIKDTPRRVADMMIGELTKGLNYAFFPKCTATPNGVDNVEAGSGPGVKVRVGGYNQMVLVQRIRTISLCEHHLQTIDGFTHIAYVPGPKVLGLSKFARVVEFFASRPQIQERMTDQIYHSLAFILETPDIGVIQDAVHNCMRARGVRQPESRTVTDKMGGKFMDNPALRKEFADAIARSG